MTGMCAAGAPETRDGASVRHGTFVAALKVVTRTWRSLGLAAGLAGLGACPATPTPGDPDARIDGGSGLTFTWQAVPAVPGDVGSDMSIDDAVLLVRDIRAIGDSAPGDDRTTTAMAQLAWDATRQPAPLTYPLAPAGLYSHLELRADGGLFDALKVHGHARQGGVIYPFELEVDGPLSISVPLGVELPVGGSASVRIDVEFGEVVRAVDWEHASLEDGKLHYEEPSSGPAATALKLALKANGPL